MAGNRAAHESCYKTSDVELGPLGDMLEISINLGKTYMMHCFLMVQDVFSGKIEINHPMSLNEWVQNFEVYIGDSPDYTMN